MDAALNPEFWIQLLHNHKIVDLTVTLSENLPGWWPGNNPYRAERVAWYEDPPHYNRLLHLEEHTGTHFDPPAHFIPPIHVNAPMAAQIGSVTSDKVPIEQFFGSAAVIDMRFLSNEGIPGESPFILPNHIEQWEERNGKLMEGEIVLFNTGWSDMYYKEFPDGEMYVSIPFVSKSKPAWPCPNEQTLEILHGRGVKLVGVDTPSMGPPQLMKEVHQAGLKHGMIYVESLTNLESLPNRGALFVFLPIKCENGSGAPGRAVALVSRQI